MDTIRFGLKNRLQIRKTPTTGGHCHCDVNRCWKYRLLLLFRRGSCWLHTSCSHEAVQEHLFLWSQTAFLSRQHWSCGNTLCRYSTHTHTQVLTLQAELLLQHWFWSGERCGDMQQETEQSCHVGTWTNTSEDNMNNLFSICCFFPHTAVTEQHEASCESVCVSWWRSEHLPLSLVALCLVSSWGKSLLFKCFTVFSSLSLTESVCSLLLSCSTSHTFYSFVFENDSVSWEWSRTAQKNKELKAL